VLAGLSTAPAHLHRDGNQHGVQLALCPGAAHDLRGACRRGGRPDVSLADVAARCGWADHAHMDRDWRDLAGASPTRGRTDDVLIGA
jgi:AraC-like DNA-binding protein